MFGRIQYEYIYIQLYSHTEVLAHPCFQAKEDTIFCFDTVSQTETDKIVISMGRQ